MRKLAQRIQLTTSKKVEPFDVAKSFNTRQTLQLSGGKQELPQTVVSLPTRQILVRVINNVDSQPSQRI